MNSCNFTGRITKDLELKISENTGKKFVRFGLAVQREYKNQEGKYDADFISVIAFDNQAEYLSKYASKGSMIEISSKVNVGKYENNGMTIYKTDFMINNCKILMSKPSEMQQETKIVAKEVETDDAFY